MIRFTLVPHPTPACVVGAPAREITDAGGEASAYGVDVGSVASVNEAASVVVDEVGEVDILVNNVRAGSTQRCTMGMPLCLCPNAASVRWIIDSCLCTDACGTQAGIVSGKRLLETRYACRAASPWSGSLFGASLAHVSLCIVCVHDDGNAQTVA